MKVDLALAAVFIAFTPGLSSSLAHSVQHPSLGHRRRTARTQTPRGHPFLLRPHHPPVSSATSASDHHFQWWGAGGTSPELVQSGWYGFNRFSPRSARTTRGNSAKAEYLLGETSMFPHVVFSGQENRAVLDLLMGELQRSVHPVSLVSQQYLQPRIVMIDQAVGLPPGILVPVRHPRHHRHFSNQHPTGSGSRHQQRYHQQRRQQNHQQSAPVPVTIKVVPLKITSADIANALRSVSFLDFPLDFGGKDGGDDANADVAYDDDDGKGSSDEDESGLPPPSSHVAMPVDKDGLGIVYADSRRMEHSLRGTYQPR